ncbi:serine/threonine-protein kinase [Urbifossiella limnaea]|uniref:Serine/threonine-protein kinase PrkC n=1 Tax=Urbifossiella limnaea TaxID=2528023 RepID=A0A517XPU0_9BACT|nr:serine/threonine-protein kinase [Urbifossiella limnaea]QDU19530.1 Serine/threonine-protein kinase PrkC [Urbifossiella limnaea]
MSDRAGDSGECGDEVADLLAGVADDYLARRSAGEDPDPEEYAARHPALADDIRWTLAALRLAAPTPRPEPPHPPTGSAPQRLEELGDFRIVREVGRGGMGVVYEAEQVSLGGRRVALKILPFAAVADPRQLQRFRNEALAAASLDHPHVVRVHGVGCDRGFHYIAMQFVDGRTLADLVRERRGEAPPTGTPQPAAAAQDPTRSFAPDTTDDTPEDRPQTPGTASSRPPADAAYVRRVVEWGIQAADALEHAHAVGVVHRDVKPGNLLVDGSGHLFVADFGLAKLAADPGMTGTGDVIGTLRYMSPEQAGAKHDLVDHRSDVYSLGATLYELLTLTPAFAGRDRHEVLARVVSADPVAPRKVDRSIPRDLETVVLKAIEKDPARRYPSAKQFAADLRCVLEQRPVWAKRAGTAERVGKWARRNSAVVMAAFASLAVALVVLTGALVIVRGERDERDRALKDRTDALKDRTDALAAEREARKAEAAALGRAQADFQRSDRALTISLGVIARLGGANDQKLEKLFANPRTALDLNLQMAAALEEAVSAYPDKSEYPQKLVALYSQITNTCRDLRKFETGAEVGNKMAAMSVRTLAACRPGDRYTYLLSAYLGENNVGMCLHQQGRGAEAEAAFRRALAHLERAEADITKPGMETKVNKAGTEWFMVLLAGRSKLGLATLMAERGAATDADTACREILELISTQATRPKGLDSQLYQLKAQTLNLMGEMYTLHDRYADAAGAFRDALESFEKTPNSAYGLGWFLATCPDPCFRDPSRAIQLAKAELAREPDNRVARRVLGVALAQSGDWAGVHELYESKGSSHLSMPLDSVELFLRARCLERVEPDRSLDARRAYDFALEDAEKHNARDPVLIRVRAEAIEDFRVAVAPPPRRVMARFTPPAPEKLHPTARQLVGVWLHQVVDGTPVPITLRADATSIIGRATDPMGQGSWSFDGKTLIMRWPDETAPGGEWVDTCQLSEDRSSYSGTNQINIPVSGRKEVPRPNN